MKLIETQWFQSHSMVSTQTHYNPSKHYKCSLIFSCKNTFQLMSVLVQNILQTGITQARFLSPKRILFPFDSQCFADNTSFKLNNKQCAISEFTNNNILHCNCNLPVTSLVHLCDIKKHIELLSVS
jgi:hypothetical protein